MYVPKHYKDTSAVVPPTIRVVSSEVEVALNTLKAH